MDWVQFWIMTVVGGVVGAVAEMYGESKGEKKSRDLIDRLREAKNSLNVRLIDTEQQLATAHERIRRLNDWIDSLPKVGSESDV